MTEARPSTPNQCVASRKDGQRCTAPVISTSPYCFAHDPGLAQQRQAARRKGGQAHANKVRLRNLVPPRLTSTYDVLEAALLEVRDGNLDPKVASAMASIARSMVAVLTSGEMEQRVRDVEARLTGAAERRMGA